VREEPLGCHACAVRASHLGRFSDSISMQAIYFPAGLD
jgi:hypothetical protein